MSPLCVFAFGKLRVVPQQGRAIESVSRILTAATEMIFRRASPDSVSVDRVAAEAGVTPQAVYRYFRGTDELIATGLRRVVIREHERVVELLSRRMVADEAEMARLVVGIVLDTCGRIYSFPSHVQADLIREYRQVGYDASPLMSEIICKDADRADVRSTIDVSKASVALAATIAVATSFFLRKRAPLQETWLEEILARVFVDVLRSDGCR